MKAKVRGLQEPYKEITSIERGITADELHVSKRTPCLFQLRIHLIQPLPLMINERISKFITNSSGESPREKIVDEIFLYNSFYSKQATLTVLKVIIGKT